MDSVLTRIIFTMPGHCAYLQSIDLKVIGSRWAKAATQDLFRFLSLRFGTIARATTTKCNQSDCFDQFLRVMRPQFGRGYLPGPVTKTPRAAANMDGFFVSDRLADGW